MTKLQAEYEMIEGAIAYLEAGIQNGSIPPLAGRKGLAELRERSAALFARMCA